LPIFRREDLKDRPPWVEIEDFERFTLDHSDATHGTRTIGPTAPREMVVVLSGEVTAESPHGRVTLKRRDWMDIPAEGVTLTSAKTITSTYACEVMHVRGDWKDVNIVAIFHFNPDRPLELHYHDFVEYWFIFRGHFRAQLDDEEADFRPDLLLATPPGHEHGIADPPEVVEGVGFSTTRVGKKRQGHLHRDEHGAPDLNDYR
jgi:mannose-6-phosphate isomerase-like protein (cupin superfamily)